MTKKKSTSAREPRYKVEFGVTPESEQLLRERLASPEEQKLLDELALVYAEAALVRVIKEADALRQTAQITEVT
jgi:hypothetical protein